ncbi:MAG: SGNH/GDSL hydrolase family protein [Lentisphaerae bacterium]|nr:SGNH/GDSL hydrolase family protein [Lentisphaerota bacterium]
MEKIFPVLCILFLLLILTGGCVCLSKKASITPPRLRLTLPEVIYAVPGIESNIYFENVIDSAAFNAYAVEVKCERGTHGNSRWFWTPEKQDAGKTFDLELRLFNDYGRVAAARCKVVVAKEPADYKKKITLSLLADSGVNCLYPTHLLNVMREAGFVNYTPVGKHSGGGKKPVPGGIAHDGYGGFSWGCFLERWLYSAEELPQAQTEAEKEQMRAFGISNLPKSRSYMLRSPLLKLVNGKKTLDIPGWLKEINDGKAPDFIVIQLGGNDMFGAMEDQRQQRLAKTMKNARKLLTVLRKNLPDSIIGVTTGVCGCGQDGYGANYKCLQSQYQYRRNIQSYNLAIAELVKGLKDPKISLIPLNQCIDPDNSYLWGSYPIHARHRKKVIRDRNALHPSITGGYQLGDAIYCWLRKQLEK